MITALLLHYNTEGQSWRNNGIASERVFTRNKHTKEISTTLGQLVDHIINDAIAKGYLAK
jgi:putative hydrolase of HD superfamily